MKRKGRYELVIKGLECVQGKGGKMDGLKSALAALRLLGRAEVELVDGKIPWITGGTDFIVRLAALLAKRDKEMGK